MEDNPKTDVWRLSDQTNQGGAVEDLPVGMIIDGRYQIKHKIGSGGCATIYLAHWGVRKRDVALKVMRFNREDETFVKRFIQEAEITAKLRHPNIVEVYDYGVISETNQPYMVMEHLEGHDLDDEIQSVGRIDKKRIFTLFRPVIDALAKAHEQNIVHKDLKPSNLFIVHPGMPDEIMKITDFGVARNRADVNAKLTMVGQMMGTPRYLAPEYIKTQTVTPAIDVYQVALIMSEAHCGRPAVTGNSNEAMMKHVSGQLDMDAFLTEGVVGEVFQRAFALDDKSRYRDCGEFGRAIDMIAACFGIECDPENERVHGATADVAHEESSQDDLIPSRKKAEILRKSEEYAKIGKLNRDEKEDMLRRTIDSLAHLKHLRMLMVLFLVIFFVAVVGVVLYLFVFRN